MQVLVTFTAVVLTVIHGHTFMVKIAWVDGAIILICIAALLVLRTPKVRSTKAMIPALPPSATPAQVKAYAEAMGLIGQTIPYVARLEKPDPQKSGNMIYIGEITGEVRNAGTSEELYIFGRNSNRYSSNAKDRFNAALKAFEASRVVRKASA
jgi:hypothetical protein